jgi:sulfur dioxygenase
MRAISMIFRQLYDANTSTYTYLLADEASRKAVLIDPVREQLERDLKLLGELGLELRYVLDTHVHADHVTAAGALRARTGAQTIGGPGGAACADFRAREGDTFRLGAVEIGVLETPGHTPDSLSFLVEDRVFTGDALLIRGTGRTDFQSGDAGVLHDAITGKLFRLPDTTRVYPGHDYRGHSESSIGEEKRHNPRLAGKSRAEFIELMSQLHLPRPARIDEAVPANRACGSPSQLVAGAWNDALPAEGYRQLSARSARPLLGQVRFVDVREPDEYRAEHIAGAELVPERSLRAVAESWPRPAPIVLVCRSGRRSAQAAEELGRLGFEQVFNLEGGMLAWAAQGFDVVRAGAQGA